MLTASPESLQENHLLRAANVQGCRVASMSSLRELMMVLQHKAAHSPAAALQLQCTARTRWIAASRRVLCYLAVPHSAVPESAWASELYGELGSFSLPSTHSEVYACLAVGYVMSLWKCSAKLQTNVYPSITSTTNNVRNAGARTGYCSSFLTEFYFSISCKHIFRLSTKQCLCQLYTFVNFQFRVFEKELPCYMQKLYGEINSFFFQTKIFSTLLYIIINHLCVKLWQQTPTFCFVSRF